MAVNDAIKDIDFSESLWNVFALATAIITTKEVGQMIKRLISVVIRSVINIKHLKNFYDF